MPRLSWAKSCEGRIVDILRYDLVLTSYMMPEQYDVFKGDQQVAYLRLRHGEFYASCPDCCDTIVYKAKPSGFGGRFNDDERDRYLSEAIAAIDAWYAAGKQNEK